MSGSIFGAKPTSVRRKFLLLENGKSVRSENWRVLLSNCKDGVKDCLKLPSYDLTGARSPRCNTAWILDPASPKHLSSKRDTGLDQTGKPPRNLTNTH